MKNKSSNSTIPQPKKLFVMNNLKSYSCSCLLCPSKYTDISISSTPLYADILHVLLKDCLLNLSETDHRGDSPPHKTVGNNFASGCICRSLAWSGLLKWENSHCNWTTPFPRHEVLNCLKEERVNWVSIDSSISNPWLWILHDKLLQASVVMAQWTVF